MVLVESGGRREDVTEVEIMFGADGNGESRDVGCRN